MKDITLHKTDFEFVSKIVDPQLLKKFNITSEKYDKVRLTGNSEFFEALIDRLEDKLMTSGF